MWMGSLHRPGMTGMKETLRQKGYILLLVPVLLMVISLLAFQMMSRSKVSMRIAGAELDYLQTRLCAQQCAAVAVNATRKTLESNGKVSSHNESCLCGDPTSAQSMTCTTDYGQPVEKNQTNCYGLEAAST